MNKKVIWAIAIIVVLALAVFIYTSFNKEKPSDISDNKELILDNIPESDFASLDSADDDFSQIDSALEEIE